MLYANGLFLVFIILAGLLAVWLRKIVKQAVVQPVNRQTGLLMDARLTEKNRLQVFWDDNKFKIGFIGGVSLMILIGWLAG